MRSTKPMSRGSLSIMLATASIVLFAILGAGPAFASCSPFDCFAAADGDQATGPAAMSDWQDIAKTVAVATDPAKGSDTKFSGGDKENQPGSWKFITGNNTPKTDILEGWSKLENNVLKIAFVRAKQSGDTFLSFELNQLPAVQKADGQMYPQRSPGDILFTYDIATTNKLSFGMCTWDGNASSGVWRRLDGTPGTAVGGSIKTCTKLDPSGPPPIAEGNVNWGSQITGYLTGFDPIAAGKFGEAAVDFGSNSPILKAFMLGAMKNPCAPNGWFWMHSRASESVTSQPKDVLTGAPLTDPKCDFTIDKKVSLTGNPNTFVDAGATDALAATVGNTVTYSVTVTNTKDTPLTINVTDPLCDSPLSDGAGHSGNGDALAPGASITYTCPHTVTGSESGGNPFPNTACANADAMIDNGAGGVTTSLGQKCDDAWVQSFQPGQLAEATGTKFLDANGNGTHDPEETTPLPGFVFYVDYNGNKQLDSGEPAAASGSDGKWTISGIKVGPDPVMVRELADATYKCTIPGQGDACGYSVTFTGGTTTVGEFGNAPPPPPEQVVAPEVVTPPPNQVVLGERITPGRAQLLGPTGCQARAFHARVKGVKVAKVVFILDGHRIKTLTRKNFRGTFAVRIDPRHLKVGVHRLLATVTFQRGSATKAKTFRLAFQRCPRALRAPRFTG